MPYALDRVRTEHEQLRERYRSIEALAERDDRDPTEAEQTEMASITERLRALQPRIADLTEMERSLSATSEALAGVPAGLPTNGRPPSTPTMPSRNPAERYRSWGEFAQAAAAGEISREDRDAVEEGALSYAIEHARALVDVTTADVAGIVPPIWVRTIADTISAAQPFVEAFSQLPLPDAGMTLTYPKITARPLVGKQATQKTEVASRKTTITTGTAPVSTYGGGEDVSVQVMQRTDPSYLSLMLELYAEAMSIVVDTDAITAALAAITTHTDLGTAATTYTAQLAAAAAGILDASRLMPDTFVVDTTIWAAFAGAADATGRPLFPNVSPSNPVGSTSLDSTTANARGLTVIVDANMPANTGILGNRAAFTSLLGPVQTLTMDNASKLGRDHAVFRFAAFLARRPDAATRITIGATP